MDAFDLAVESPVAQTPLPQQATGVEKDLIAALETPVKTFSLDNDGGQPTEVGNNAASPTAERGRPTSFLSTGSSQRRQVF